MDAHGFGDLVADHYIFGHTERISREAPVLVVRHDKLVFEHYFAGEDEQWGRPLGTVAYDATMPHDLRSATKSVVGLVVGIAVERGWIRSLDTPCDHRREIGSRCAISSPCPWASPGTRICPTAIPPTARRG